MPRNKQQKEPIESYYDWLIREKVEDMERRVKIGILDQTHVNARYVHTYIDWRVSIKIEQVIDWFHQYRPNLITEKDQETYFKQTGRSLKESGQ